MKKTLFWSLFIYFTFIDIADGKHDEKYGGGGFGFGGGLVKRSIKSDRRDTGDESLIE